MDNVTRIKIVITSLKFLIATGENEIMKKWSNKEHIEHCIKDLMSLINDYIAGETCDHSVGICYCDAHYVLDNAERVLESLSKSNGDDK